MSLPDDLRSRFNVPVNPGTAIIALAGNPNTGKSTLFNALTGLKQHTGNWPGKTVLQARGSFHYAGKEYVLVDLPGTYSLLANSPEERVARDFLCFARPDATVVVVDATCLERNLNLVLQVLEITGRVIVCANMMDEARRKKIYIDLDALREELGVPVVATEARNGTGLTALKETIHALVGGRISTSPRRLTYDPAIEAAVAGLEEKLPAAIREQISGRWVALRVLDQDRFIMERIRAFYHLPEWGVFREGYKCCPV
ncbi:MAG TPA: iron transporter FeoB [Desulfotomaculum sp.]|nr:iron transporter FeoB [Desulfotomaculum sp.]